MMRHPPRGIAASDFRPLCKIPHCCLPQEYGPYLSPIAAGHHLRPATRHRLGRLLPHQLPDRTHPSPQVVNLSSHRNFTFVSIWGISHISMVVPRLGASQVRVTRSFATFITLYCYKITLVRLACVRRSASVHPEPGSNSSKKIPYFISYLIY